MAAALSVAGSKSNTVSDEERRWMVVGICLNKVLTPALRHVLVNEIPNWYQVLLQPPIEIDKQTYGKHHKTLPPSTLKLNYDSINNNTVPRAYDYAVKDPLSLAKLLMKPFMANFTGFDQTMDTSAVLSVMCEAQPFISSGADIIAKKIRSDIRNEWAHCNFSHWTDPNFQTAVEMMKSLIKNVNLTSVEEEKFLNDLDNWQSKGMELCFGQPVDPELLKLVKSEISELMESVRIWKEDSESLQILERLQEIESSIHVHQQIPYLIKRQDKVEKQQAITAGKMDKLEKQCQNHIKTEEDIPYIFSAPLRNQCFTGRQSQFQNLERILGNEEMVIKVCVAAVCGLGGIGKTSLVTEYAHQMKRHYKGGVYWFSCENDTMLENSVNDVALQLRTFHESFYVTLSETLQRIAQIGKPWLIVLDCLDQLSISQNVTKLVSGPWQQGVSGHLVIITRRKPCVLVHDIQSLDDCCCCIVLECFEPEEAKQFLFSKTGIACDDETRLVADHLVKELGRLPLALEQACAHIKSLDCSLSLYFEQYKNQRLRLLHDEKARPVSVYESPERLAVRTTWILNFEHMKKNINGKSAIRFVTACSFLNANEIQEELINVGEPFVEDEDFRKCVATALGSRQVLKLLTDFSLFKDLQGRCVSVHRLVQEVIIENLTPKEQAGSIADALRMLRCAFLKHPSPDQHLSNSAENQHKLRHIDLSNNTSLFYPWSKLCTHTHELRRHLVEFLNKCSSAGFEEQLFFPQTARIIYESAVHLSVNSRHEEAMRVLNFAYRFLDWVPLEQCEVSIELEERNTLFPYTIPLPKLLQRVIRQCCRIPFAQNKPISLIPSNSSVSNDSEKSEQRDKKRLEGNQLFKESHFKEAMEAYSFAIHMSKGTNFFDPRLLSNRASAYLKLEQYDNALKDSKHYIVQCPDCWKGYAKKALALHGLNRELCAEMAAALAFYRDGNVFRQFEPFKATFPRLEERIFVCDRFEQLSKALPSILKGTVGDSETGVDSLKILLLGSEEYDMSEDHFDPSQINVETDYVTHFAKLSVINCVLLGVVRTSNSRVSLNFKSNFGIQFLNKCIAANLTFKFEQGNCYGCCHSFVMLDNCYFTSGHAAFPGFLSEGNLNAVRCEFRDCKAGGLLCAVGTTDVVRCTFSGNGKAGLEVRDWGSLKVNSSHMHDNCLDGLAIGPNAKECLMVDCQVHNNKREGIAMTDTVSGAVKLIRNDIFNNDHYGIFIRDSHATIEDNNVFENDLWGIWVQNNSWCHVSRNKIFRNKFGGIRVGYRVKRSTFPESIVEFNNIYDNVGCGFVENVNMFDIRRGPDGTTHYMSPLVGSTDSLKSAKCIDNKCWNNEEQKRRPAAETTKIVQRCSYMYCQVKDPSKKCVGCFTAEYCGTICQKRHWKSHKKLCKYFLTQCSVLVEIMPLVEPGPTNEIALNFYDRGRASVGPEYCSKPPNDGRTKFVVKVQSIPGTQTRDSRFIYVYDRSLTIHGTFISSHFNLLVREFGVICQRKCEEKKLFLFASLSKDGKLRIFTNEFAPLNNW